jgi:hypothetical protein
MGGLAKPYYPVLGNHDYQKSYDPAIEEGVSTSDTAAIESVWKKVLDIDPYYSLVHKGIRLIFLNANRGDARTELCVGEKVEAFCTGSFDAEQIAWLEGELSAGDPSILFFHHPPITDSTDAMFSFTSTFLVVEGDAFYATIKGHADGILAIFVGHGHVWERDKLDKKIPVYETGSVGDTGGNADNIHVVTVDPNTLKVDVVIGREGVKYYSDTQ